MAIWAGLLTIGSPYSPTPSQRLARQWLVLLAFVPDHSGAPVRELHPLPARSPHIARYYRFIAGISHSGGEMSRNFLTLLSQHALSGYSHRHVNPLRTMRQTRAA